MHRETARPAGSGNVHLYGPPIAASVRLTAVLDGAWFRKLCWVFHDSENSLPPCQVAIAEEALIRPSLRVSCPGKRPSLACRQ